MPAASRPRTFCIHICYLKCIESNPYTGLDRPLGLQDVEATRISRQSAH
jgi:hypothetical protein